MLARPAAAVVLVSLGLAPSALAATPNPGTLTVTGQGSVTVVPDTASLNVSVIRSAPRSALALSAANRVTDGVVAAARRSGISAAQIQTESINTLCGHVAVGPKGHTHRVQRCTATEQLSITTTAARVGGVIDAATHAGASSVDGPNFSFSDPSTGEISAENAAIIDARAQANATAAQLGETVTGVQSVSLNPQPNGVGFSSSASSSAPPAASSTPTVVRPGTQQVSAAVQVVYTIAPAAS